MIKRGDIYYLNKHYNSDNIQLGRRPVIIIQNNVGHNNSPTTIVVPLTSKLKRPIPTHCFISKRDGGLNLNSTALCEQIFTVNKADLEKYIGTVTNTRTLKRLNRCIQISLNL